MALLDTVEGRFAYVIERSGLKPGQYAKRLGKHAPQIAAWLSGEKAISVGSAKDIYVLSGAPTGWLLNGEGEVPDLQPLPPVVDARVETEILTSLLNFLPTSDATPREIAALHEEAQRLVAHTGVPNWAKALRDLRVPENKRTPEPPPEDIKVRDDLAVRRGKKQR